MLRAKDIRQRVEVNFNLNGEKQSVQLAEPTIGEASELRKQSAKLLKQAEGQDKSEDPLGDVRNYLANCVKLCIPTDQIDGVMTQEEWVSLVNRTGGERSPLVVESLKLCGMSAVSKANSEEQDPIPL